MYVGDNPLHDVDPPKTIGMKAIQSVRGGRHENLPAVHQPDHTIKDFDELVEIMTASYRPVGEEGS